MSYSQNYPEKVKSKLEEAIKELNDSYARWDYIYKNGGSDPFWADGVNLYLIRNHIFYYKGQIKELCEANGLELPPEYNKPVPEEVPDDYMAKPDEIRKNAKEAYEVYCSTDIFERCRDIVGLKPKFKEIATNIANYKSGCKEYIEQDDLVGMRRYNPARIEGEIKSAEDFLKRDDIWGTEGIRHTEFVQCTLFD